ncbi:hypothetical protein [Alteribacter natronophilus]|uniref:hypothetical protein n=1 Tax=Alteribacter natronophilus TaxID=2583810 RepID=UPI00110F2072|nr:hypothetical protein [Alteribacter natronophilus]TMW70898.1 hypothetical protein FGB90_13020 [Alteribacter natronophilus]
MTVISRLASFLIGIFVMDFWFHQGQVHAFGFTVDTFWERIGALGFAGVVTLAVFWASWAFFSRSFFHGVIFAAGFFATVDMVLIHWIFGLHRITYGWEAIYIEIFLVILGVVMVVFALRNERGGMRDEAV